MHMRRVQLDQGMDSAGRPGPGGAGASPIGSQHRLLAAALQSLAREMNELADQAAWLVNSPAESFSADSGVFSRIARRRVPRWHFAMLNDTERNDALVAALERAIPAGATVLDIGAGSGFLAMAAARAGAGRVITCEMNPILAEIARQVVAEHGLSDVITVIDRPSTELRLGWDLDRPVDVLISEIIDCGIVGEGLLPSVRHARDHLLAADGKMLPSAARLYGRMVNSQAVLNLNQATTAGGFDVSLMNTVATRSHFPVRLNTWPHRFLTDEAQLLEFDLARDPLEPGERLLSLTATADGEAHALVVRFELDLSDGIMLRNSLDGDGSHWMPGWVPLEKPLPVKAGETVHFQLGWSDDTLSVSF